MAVEKVEASSLGARAAEAIFLHGADPTAFTDPYSPEFAEAAIVRFAELHAARPRVYDQVLTGARRSASSQSEHKYQGINEVVQNADDQRASWVRVGFADVGPSTWLLFSHDGVRVDLGDVLPMALPFLTTKAAEAEATGRFGIGLKTLDRLGDRLEVHSPPYHFAAQDNDLHLAAPWPSVPGLYDPKSAQTLVCLRLTTGGDRQGISAWLEQFDPSALLFLRSVRRLSLFSPAADLITDHQLIWSAPKRMRSSLLPGSESIEYVGLRTPTGDRRWSRYTWRSQPPADIKPRHKETPDHCSISLAVPHRPEPGQLFVWLPTPQKGWLPFHFNADFEPTVDRESIQDTLWNRWLLDRVGDLALAVAAMRLATQPRTAWRLIPIVPEQSHGYAPWLEEALENMARGLHERLADQGPLTIQGDLVPIRSLAYEAPALEGLVGSVDLKELSPDRVALPADARDKDGQWRRVLSVIDGPEELMVSTALNMLAWDEATLGSRPPAFFVLIAAAALDADLAHLLGSYSCIVTADLLRVKPSPSAKELLVREQHGEGLAFRLGLARAIHPEYLRTSPASAKVREWLEKNRHLTARPTPEKTLSSLHAKALGESVELDPESLRLLRDELGELDEKQRDHHSRRIGAVIWVDGFAYQNGIRSRLKVRPGEAYQPKSIDKQDQQLSWAQAAGETPGLKWVDSRYADSLAATQRRVGSGPSAFFRLLGARTAPRLAPSPRNLELRDSYAYSTNRKLPIFQHEAIASLGAPVDGLTGDYISPDLDAVTRDIAASVVSDGRSLRARALIHSINRQWAEYRTRISATTVQAYYSLRPTGRVPSTWLSELASTAWMTSQAGNAAAPADLVLDTAETRLVFGDDEKRFAAELDESIDEAFLRALGIELSPSSTDIVDQLQRLRDETTPGSPVDEELPGRLYRVLAGRMQGQKTRRGELSRAQLRAKFGIDRDRPGLVYAQGRWYSPNTVFLEPPIFKSRRPFVPDRPALRPLWDALGVRPPGLADCVAVLGEIATAEPGPDEEAILLDTYRAVEELLPRATRRERVEIERLPIWTSAGWRATSPVYAIQQAPDLRAALGVELATWLHDGPLGLPNLVAARGVTVLSRHQFEPAELSSAALLKSDSMAELFTVAVGHLREVLASRDAGTYERLRPNWKALEAAKVWLVPELRLRTTIGVEVVEIAARGHIVESTPIEVFFVSEDDAGSAAVGGALIASLFSDVLSGVGIDFMWQYAWLAATAGQRPKGIRLAERDNSPEPEPATPSGGGTKRAGPRSTSKNGGAAPDQKSTTASQTRQPPPEPRNLKDFSGAQVGTSRSSGDDESSGEVHRRKRKPLRDDPQSKGRQTPTGTRTYPNYTAEQREDAGVAALRIVLAKRRRSLTDMRREHGVGSDLRDDRGVYYELKVHAGDIPDEVTLEDSQLERALREGRNFVLAVVGGVEQDERTVVKLIENPAERLNLRTSNKLSLFGVTTKKGEQFEIVTSKPRARQ